MAPPNQGTGQGISERAGAMCHCVQDYCLDSVLISADTLRRSGGAIVQFLRTCC